MNNDLKIAQGNKMLEISEIAKKINIEDIELYGKYKAKVNVKEDSGKCGKLILVTAINPTKAGEGKSTTTIGLSDGLSRLNKKVIACLREPSLGPVFGLKGGATGGGHAQVVPMEDINLHFTGDMHAITTANNLISAILDNSIYQGNILNIDPEKVVWKRCIDMNDRVLRSITIAQDKKINGVTRKDGFVITVATEVMAILCLSKNLKDFQKKIDKCIVAYTYDDKPVYVKDLNITGAIAIIMKEAMKPNLVQTLEHTPVFIHGGPFANIAHGCNSIIATKTALNLTDYVVTEAGFGADLGAEKFLDIKCREANLKPNAIVLVATIRALKMHGGVLKEDLEKENVEALIKGCANLKKHIESIENYDVPYVIAINKFSSDTKKEIEALQKWCDSFGYLVSLADGWAKGSLGMLDLAKSVIELCEKKNDFKFLYDLDISVREKIETIVKKIYGGKDIEFNKEALKKLEIYEKEYSRLPICMAKTPLSLSDDPNAYGRPENFTIHISDLKVSLGAGFIVVYTGEIMTLPGLGKTPAAISMGVDDNNNSYGLF